MIASNLSSTSDFPLPFWYAYFYSVVHTIYYIVISICVFFIFAHPSKTVYDQMFKWAYYIFSIQHISIFLSWPVSLWLARLIHLHSISRVLWHILLQLHWFDKGSLFIVSVKDIYTVYSSTICLMKIWRQNSISCGVLL